MALCIFICSFKASFWKRSKNESPGGSDSSGCSRDTPQPTRDALGLPARTGWESQLLTSTALGVLQRTGARGIESSPGALWLVELGTCRVTSGSCDTRAFKRPLHGTVRGSTPGFRSCHSRAGMIPETFGTFQDPGKGMGIKWRQWS